MQRSGTEKAFPSHEEILGPHLRDRADGLLPELARVLVEEAEGVDLGGSASAPGAELDPAVGEDVDQRDLLGHPNGVIDRGAEIHDSRYQADSLGLNSHGEAGQMGCRGV
jgi:hypothetical protein